jgi:hypothetical protein
MSAINWNDSLNLISKLTPKRIWNGLKVLSSYYASVLFNRPIQWGYPVSISFEPTTSCNLRCPQCPSGLREFTRNTGMLDLTLFKKIIDQDSSEKKIIDDFIADDIQIEIESGQEAIDQDPLSVSNISPDSLVRDYESIKVLSMNPQTKKKVMDLIDQSKEDLQKISRLLNGF